VHASRARPRGAHCSSGRSEHWRTAWPTDRLGRNVPYVYDSQNRLVTVTNPAGGVARYACDTQDRMTSITNRRRITLVQNRFDVNSRTCQKVHADNRPYTYYYITADRATLPYDKGGDTRIENSSGGSPQGKVNRCSTPSRRGPAEGCLPTPRVAGSGWGGPSRPGWLLDCDQF
jgi:YD repeat-containing protein